MKFTATIAIAFAALPATGVPRAPLVTVSDVHYRITFNRATAAARSLDVAMTFTASAAGPVELSLPAWTPGAYEISNFARRVSGFRATQARRQVEWDKLDFDTWRVQASAPGELTVSFRFLADTLDNAMAWAKTDFVFANGTNLFLYPEGANLAVVGATVAFITEPTWTVATGMSSNGEGLYRAASYHDLVDMPFFVGRFDVDSARVEGVWHRVASYPVGIYHGADRQLLWDQLQRMVPVMSKVFGATPWPDYTTLLVFDSAYGGGSALEHQNSHLGIYSPEFIGNPVLASITAHEIFHAWNVKRLRPADMVPYRYDGAQPTTLLWISEGITDYYADLAMVRGGVIDSTIFLAVTAGKITEVSDAVPVALEDASLSAWIKPTDGTASLYYPKGSLAGLMIDVLIRDATDNKSSLDDVMKNLYRSTFLAGTGFTAEDWWNETNRLAGRDLQQELWKRYIDGRDPFPWGRVAPLAGMAFAADSVSEPRLGVGTTGAGGKETVTTVVPGSSAAEAGLEVGDVLLKLGSITVDPSFGSLFRLRYGRQIGQQIPVTVIRGGQEITLTLTVRSELKVAERLEFDRRPSLKAARIRHGILTGTTDQR